MREGERVTPLELFFDLVFVLALTQCTTLAARTPTWLGLLKGMLIVYEAVRYADVRDRVRHHPAGERVTT